MHHIEALNHLNEALRPLLKPLGIEDETASRHLVAMAHEGAEARRVRHAKAVAIPPLGGPKSNTDFARKVVERGIPELVSAMESGRISAHAASVIADAKPQDQRRVLAEGIEEEVWAAKVLRKRLRRAEREREREEARKRKIVAPQIGDPIRLYNCQFQRLEEVAEIAPGSVQLIGTDIPYDGNFLDQLPELAALATRVLADGGLFVTYCGQFYLNQAYRVLDRHLDYGWTRCSRWVGNATICHPRQVTSKWKPILVYSKGPWRGRGRWHDTTLFEGREKDWHHWQQPLGEVEQLVRDFSDPGDLVVDPCGGGFTTAVACHLLKRRCIACDVDRASVVLGQERLALCRSHGRDVLRPLRDQSELD